MNVVNCTPHDVVVFSSASAARLAEAAKRAADGSVSVWETALAAETPLAVFPPSGMRIRVAQTRREIGMLDGIPVNTSEFGQVEGLPEQRPDTWYIVSGLVLAAAPDRPDLLVPAPAVRDWRGQVVGCAGFDANPAGAQRLMLEAAPAPASAAEAEPVPAPEPEAATEAAPAKSVVLYDAGERRIDVIRALRDAGVEFNRAKALVRMAEYRPTTIVENTSLPEAQKIARVIADLGGEAKIVDAD